MRRLALALVVLGSLGAALLFALPWLAARYWSAAWLTPHGLELETEDLRPAWPWGVRAARARLRHPAFELPLEDVSARLEWSGPRLEARLGAGELLVRVPDYDPARGFLRATDLPAAYVMLPPHYPVELEGAIDGVVRWDGGQTLEAGIGRGRLTWLGGTVALPLDFRRLLVSAERDVTGDVEIRLLEITGPPLWARARGRIDRDGRLDLRVSLDDVQEPVLSLLRMLGTTPEALPNELSVRGTTDAPRISELPGLGPGRPAPEAPAGDALD